MRVSAYRRTRDRYDTVEMTVVQEMNNPGQSGQQQFPQSGQQFPQQSQFGSQQQQEEHRWSSNQTVFTVEVATPQPETMLQIAQQLQSRQGIKEVSLRRDSRTPHVRIQATPEGLADLQRVVPQLIQSLQQSYGTQSYGS